MEFTRSAHEIDAMLEAEYNGLWHGQSSMAELVTDLKWRFRTEKQR
jgi:hypothetical protein